MIRNYFTQILTVFRKSSHLKDIVINSGSSAAASAFGLLFFILISRSLGPNQFGLFSGLIALSLLLSDLFDLGINTSIPKFIAKYDNILHRAEMGRFLALAFIIKIALIGSVSLIGCLLVIPLTKSLFNSEISPTVLSLTLGGAVVLALFNFTMAALQSRRNYLSSGMSNITGNLLRLILLIVLLLFLHLSIVIGIFIYFLGNLIAAIIGLIWLPIKLFKIPTSKDLKVFFSFNKWLSIAIILSAVSSRLDSILLIKLNSSFQAGLYGASSRVTFIFPLLISSLSGVWSARFSLIDRKAEANKLFSKVSQFVLIISVGVIALIPFSGIIINILYGKGYLEAVLPLQLLFFGWVIFLITVPAIQYIIYYLGRSHLYAFIILIQFIFIVGLDFLLIPSSGAVGAAVALLTGNLAMLLTAYLIVVISRKSN